MHPRVDQRHDIGRVRSLRALVAGVVVASTLLAVSTDAEARRRPRTRSATVAPQRVWVVGDSLAWEALPTIDSTVRAQPGVQLSGLVWGGFAPCDMIDEAIRLRDEQPRTVAVTFSGNSITPCMNRDGEPLVGDQVVDAYRADLTTLRALVPSARFVLIGQPTMPASPTSERLNTMYRELADSMNNAEFIDAGAVIESPDGSWTDRLPCLPEETADVGCVDGTIEVRAPDRSHLCSGGGPAVVGVTATCEHYSSGAVRFGRAIATSLLSPAAPPRSDVMVFGDSMVANAAPSFRNLFGSVDRTRLRARGLVTMTDWRTALTTEPIDPATTVIVALGTDDALWTDLRHVRSDATAIASRLSSVRCVVWVGVNEHASGVPSATRNRLRSVNRTVQRAIAKHRSITWLDWSARSAAHPEWFVNNTTELSAIGQAEYANAIASVIPAGCPSRLLATP
jgi:hypothetical protein